MKKFTFLSHTADIKFQAFGKTLEEAFANSVYATTFAIYEGKVKNKKVKKIKIKGKSNSNDLTSLLYNLLDEVIYLFDAEDFLVGNVKVNINKDNNLLEVELKGDNIKNYDKSKMDHIKSVTYSEMFVEKVKKEWVAQVVLDV